MNVQDVVKTLRMDPSTTTNKMIEEFALTISKEHRTHQASIIRNLIGILNVYSQVTTSTDPRNEKAKEVCDKIRALDLYIPYI